MSEAIVTCRYYNYEYMGEPIAEADFPIAAAKAQRLINQITHGRAANFAALHPSQQAAIRDAMCAQIEYYALMGTDVAVAGETSSGWTVGKVHVNGGNVNKATGAASMVCPAAIAALEQSGLMNPQVHTYGGPAILPPPWGW